MKLQPIVYTTNMAAAVEWYSTVLGVMPGYASEAWTSLSVGDAVLGIHVVETRPTNSYVEVSLVSLEPLEPVIARLAAKGIHPAKGIEAQPFGRSMLLRDPDGAPVQINEHTH